MAHVNTKQGKKITKKNQNKKYKYKNKMCVGRTNLLYLLCLISNTIPQLEQSSLQQPSRVLHHRHLQTTSYNHLLLHLLISRKEKPKQQQARNPPSRGVEKPEGPSALQPTTESLNIEVLG